MVSKDKIAILTTVYNFELYYKTSQLFPNGIKKYVIDGRNGMHGIHSIIYMMKKLKDRGIEWLIMVDEDVIFKDSNCIFSIINKMKEHNLSVCGVRDGGVVSHRNYNPYVINTFFSILNFKEIEALWNNKEVLSNQNISKNEFEEDLSSLEYSFNKISLYEPYYCFYFWLRRKGKQFLFLESKMNNDNITNEVYFQNKLILYHTWYARSYGVNKRHTDRIDTLLNGFKLDLTTKNEYLLFKSTFFKVRMLIKKSFKKVQMRLDITLKEIISVHS